MYGIPDSENMYVFYYSFIFRSEKVKLIKYVTFVTHHHFTEILRLLKVEDEVLL